MKKRLILSSFILSLFLLLFSCGIPNWFYLPLGSITFKNYSENRTTVRIDSNKYDLKIEFYLLYTITDASTESDPKLSSVLSGLRNDFRNRYRINDANANRFSSSSSPVSAYTSNQLTFNMYPFRVIGADSSMNSGDSPLFSYEKMRGEGGETSFNINYTLLDTDGKRYLEVTMTDDSGNSESHVLGRYNGGELLADEFISSDNSNDHTHVEGNDYSIYLYPVIYISSNTVSDVGYPYNNLMMVYTSDCISINL